MWGADTDALPKLMQSTAEDPITPAPEFAAASQPDDPELVLRREVPTYRRASMRAFARARAAAMISADSFGSLVARAIETAPASKARSSMALP